MREMHVVEWREAFRVVDDLGRVLAVCATREEADAFIAGQSDGGTVGGRLISISAALGGEGGGGVPF